MNLGKKISNQRKKRGFSQELLAEKCGVSLRTIQRIERNQSNPRPYTLKVIADTLNIEMEEFEQNSHLETESENTLPTINLINTSALLGVLIPFLNIIAPTIFWKRNKGNPLVNEKGKKVISFQILWFLFSVLIIIATHFFHYKITGELVSGRIPLVVIVYILLLVINVFFVLKNAIQLRKGNAEIYSFFPDLF